MSLAQLRSFFGAPERLEAQKLYIALVRQSRKAFFYQDCTVPDTLDGRFDIIVLHVFLALQKISEGTRRSKEHKSDGDDLAGERTLSVSGGGAPPEIARLLLESLFDDMDRSLREMGVGDMGVGRRIKTMSKAAFGRLEAYTQAGNDEEALRAALVRNIYRGNTPAPEALSALAGYVRTYAPD